MVMLQIIQAFTVGLIFLAGYAILYKKKYSLISGYMNRSEDEQQAMIDAGYMTVTGRGLMLSGSVLLFGLVTGLFGFMNLNVVSWLLFVLILFGTAYRGINREPKRTRKRNRIVMHVTVVFTIGVIGFAVVAGFSEHDLVTKEDHFEVTGLYGDEWDYGQVQEVSIEAKMQEVTLRTNGFSLAGRLKGRFRLEDDGRALLFLDLAHEPFLRIEMDDDTLWLNHEDPDVTESWYDGIREHVSR